MADLERIRRLQERMRPGRDNDVAPTATDEAESSDLDARHVPTEGDDPAIEP
jgi:hypothetical protein